jgi:hypothetical protein
VVKGNPPAPICLTAGTDLHLTSDPSHRQPWSPLTSYDDAHRGVSQTSLTSGSW